jgi:hypothetical protein
MPHMDQPMQPYVKEDGTVGVKPAQFDADGELIVDPGWARMLKKYMGKDRELIFERLPLQLNLGPMSTQDCMGWAKGYKEIESGNTIIEIVLNEDAAKGLQDLVEVFQLYAIGFAGIKRKPQGGGETQ